MEKKTLIEFIGRLEDLSAFSEKRCAMLSFYTKDGVYIGNAESLRYLILDRWIVPEVAHTHNKVCSIGKSKKDGKWYGWSHRAIFGFEIGDEIKEGDCCASSGYTEEYIKDHPEEDLSLPIGFKAKTEEDCKKMAIAFADSVS